MATRTSAPPSRMSVNEAMRELELAGSPQTRKIYLRHGAPEPLFGVNAPPMKALVKRIQVDHQLARQLWATGNFDARTLAVKVADPAQMTPAELDGWATASRGRVCGNYVAMLAVEGPHAAAKMRQWLGAADEHLRAVGWALLGQLATHALDLDDAEFLAHLQHIEQTIHAAPNGEREAMNMAVIQIGCRNPALRQAAVAAAQRIGKVAVDHGDTDCKTPDAATYIEKAWAHSLSKGMASPAEHERAREPQRTRC